MIATAQPHLVVLTTTLALATMSASGQGCTNPASVAAIDEQTAALSFDATTLSQGQRHTLIDNVAAAENQYFTSTGRLLVSGDDAIYEVLRDPTTGHYTQQILHSGETCKFGGLTELHGTLYANCYDSTNSEIFAATLEQDPEFRAIYPLPGTGLANGLTNDGQDHLFVASTFDGSVIRLQVSATDPLVIQARDTFKADSGFATNGIKYFKHKLYWTALFSVNEATVAPSGASSPTHPLATALTIFDDLYISDKSVLVCDYLNGSIVALAPNGDLVGATAGGVFDGPSSVLPAQGRLGLPSQALIVTERNANRVSVFEP